MRMIVGALCAVVAGCSSSTEQSDVKSQAQAVALASPDFTTLVFGSSDNLARLESVLSSVPPVDFHWVKFSLAPNVLAAARTENGVQADMTAEQGLTFSQVYASPCNPRTEDWNQCWFKEVLVGTATGVTGQVSLHISAAKVELNYDVQIEGMTDAFGLPETYNKHGSEGGYVAALQVVAQ
jgi:hypothetical protein